MIVDIKIEIPAIGSAWATANLDTRLGEIKCLFVRPELRRRGHGSRLLVEIEKVLGMHGIIRVSLLIDPVEPRTIDAATGWYEARGWVKLGPGRIQKSLDSGYDCGPPKFGNGADR